MATYSNNLTDQHDRPIIGALVSAVQSGATITQTTTDALGVFSIAVSPGTYTIQFRVSGSLVREDVVDIGLTNPYVSAPIGSADIGPNIMAAVLANPGREILIPAGAWEVSTPLVFTAGTRLKGENRTTTSINYTGSGAAFHLGPSDITTGAFLDGCGLRDITINGTGTGTGLLLEQVQNFRLDNVSVNNFAIIFDVAGCSNVFLENAQCYFGVGSGTLSGSRYLRVRAGYTAGGMADAQDSYGLFLDNCSFTAAGTGTPLVETGIELLAVDGFYMGGNNYVGQAVNLIDLKVQNADCYLGNLTFDSILFDGNNGQSTNGFRIVYNAAAPSAIITKITLNDCDFATFQNCGVQIGTGQVSAMTVSSNTFGLCAFAGLDLVGTSSLSVTGNTFTTCGTAGLAYTGGIRYNSNCDVITVVGNTFYNTPSGAKDIVPTSMPTHLQQGLNATNSGTPVPVVNT